MPDRTLTARLKEDNWDLHQIAERGDLPLHIGFAAHDAACCGSFTIR